MLVIAGSEHHVDAHTLIQTVLENAFENTLEDSHGVLDLRG